MGLVPLLLFRRDGPDQSLFVILFVGTGSSLRMFLSAHFRRG